jgi:hypothetical protein
VRYPYCPISILVFGKYCERIFFRKYGILVLIEREIWKDEILNFAWFEMKLLYNMRFRDERFDGKRGVVSWIG